jgi:hypothetical protein
MKLFSVLLFLLLSNGGAADSDLEIPENDAHVIWDRSGIQLKNEVVSGKKKTYLFLKGSLTPALPKSMTLQVNSQDAIRVAIRGKNFQKKIEISEFPAQVKVWLEIRDGKAVKIEEYKVHVRMKKDTSNQNDHLINY